MQDVGFGIIGVGLWGELHASVLACTDGVSLAGISDQGEQKAESIAQALGAMHYADYRSLLDDDLITAVSILSPDHTHTEIAIAAIEAGKHVLIQPPLAITVDDCIRISEAAERAGVKLMVDFHSRWMPPLVQARQSVVEREIGDAGYVSYQLNTRIDVPTEKLHWADRTTVGWFSGSRSVDMLHWMLGDRVRRVYTVARSQQLKDMGIDTPDFYQSVLEFESGTTAYVEDSWTFPRLAGNSIEHRLKVAGVKGVLYVNSGYTPEIFHQMDSFAADSFRHFIDCVLHDRQPEVTGRDGLDATRVVLAMQESARTRQPVHIG